jgi:hypothetical protein
MTEDAVRPFLGPQFDLAVIFDGNYMVPPRGRSGYLEWQDVRTDAGARPYEGAVSKRMRRRRGHLNGGMCY